MHVPNECCFDHEKRGQAMVGSVRAFLPVAGAPSPGEPGSVGTSRPRNACPLPPASSMRAVLESNRVRHPE